MCDAVVYEDAERAVVAIRLKTPPAQIGENWPKFAKEARKKQNIHTDGWGIQELLGDVGPGGEIEYELMLPVTGDIQPAPPLHARTLPRTKVASILFRGPLSETGRHHEKLAGWIEQQGLQISGNTRVVHLRCPHNTPEPAGYVTEIQIPVE